MGWSSLELEAILRLILRVRQPGREAPTTSTVTTRTVMAFPIYYDHHPPHTLVIPSEARNLLMPGRTAQHSSPAEAGSE